MTVINININILHLKKRLFLLNNIIFKIILIIKTILKVFRDIAFFKVPT